MWQPKRRECVTKRDTSSVFTQKPALNSRKPKNPKSGLHACNNQRWSHRARACVCVYVRLWPAWVSANLNVTHVSCHISAPQAAPSSKSPYISNTVFCPSSLLASAGARKVVIFFKVCIDTYLCFTPRSKIHHFFSPFFHVVLFIAVVGFLAWVIEFWRNCSVDVSCPSVIMERPAALLVVPLARDKNRLKNLTVILLSINLSPVPRINLQTLLEEVLWIGQQKGNDCELFTTRSVENLHSS